VGLTVNETSKPDWTKIVNELGMDNSKKGLDVEKVYDNLPE
jgi:hypothetical protein